MRYGIFSDTHANLPALEAVLKRFEEEGVDELACLGDTVGYGPQPEECCRLVREHAKFVILGNHDAAVAGRMDYAYYYQAARDALDYHASLISEESMEWLRSLPYKIEDDATHFCHGSPVDLEEFEYIFNVEQASTCLPIFESLGVATFIGHSHLCRSFAIAPAACPRGPHARVPHPRRSSATSSSWAPWVSPATRTRGRATPSTTPTPGPSSSSASNTT